MAGLVFLEIQGHPRLPQPRPRPDVAPQLCEVSLQGKADFSHF